VFLLPNEMLTRVLDFKKKDYGPICNLLKLKDWTVIEKKDLKRKKGFKGPKGLKSKT
jgi:hypothetical protein